MQQNEFTNALAKFQEDFQDVAQTENEVFEYKNRLKMQIDLVFDKHKKSELNQNSDLAKSLLNLQQQIQKCFAHWETKMEDARPMQALSAQYANRIIFLIFGKTNAGKSSFANFITELFPTEHIYRFTIQDGQNVELTERFAEGFTETTSTIQGVEIGQNFVLLDTPGLHSITKENEELTKRFVDSADAILWLTPSYSPGQIQELYVLKDELKAKKPLLPLITRSDFQDECVCDETQDILSVLRNKTSEVRKLQEHDVFERLKGFSIKDSENGITKDITIEQLSPPLSISIHAYKKEEETQTALQQSGLAELFKQLSCLIKEAKEYKVGKAKQQLHNFLTTVVMDSLDKDIRPTIEKLSQDVSETIAKLNEKKQKISAVITADVTSEVALIVDKHKTDRNKQAIATALNRLISGKINLSLQEELSSLIKNIEQASISLQESNLGDFEDNTISFDRAKGGVAKSITSSAGGIGGAIGGAAIGSMIFPGIGTAIGGFLGGLLGGAGGAALGDYFVETETITEVVGTSAEKLIDEIINRLNAEVPKQVDSAFTNAIQVLEPVADISNTLKSIMDNFKLELQIL